jgi:hypothetical protein
MNWSVTKLIVLITILCGFALGVYLKSELALIGIATPALGVLANHKHNETKQKNGHPE